MHEVTTDTVLAAAKEAGLPILEEDVASLTIQLDAVCEALQFRSLMRAQVLDAVAGVDVLLSSAYPTSPRRIVDTKDEPQTKDQALARMRRFSFATPANYAGTPSLALPAGSSAAGLPTAIRLMAKRFDEPAISQAAHAFEQATPWHTMRPAVGDQDISAG